ncbi:hypothetical protein [Desulforhopalus singaporensis]|uniref:Uncharacterized protein n=1 Tax=Desulforhopalus singaporensis TaxID=91360 RepID=A0A1H0MQ64_9BACT|nr:hypothetical protein [Desulforhopalus singaporensis]SDO82593.1 hypothetical protein SAMN05660330_01143 [Desulforhopalus singaporensis]
MNLIAQHKILLTGDSFDHCSDHVHRFFDLTSLVIYDCIETSRAHSFSGLDDRFLEEIKLAEDRNRQIIDSLLREMKKGGITTIDGLGTIPQGYLSKTFHVLSHFIDGFIGIDSSFYNLIDDSHWLTQKTRTEIDKNGSMFWLVHVDGYSTTPEEAGILHL